MTKRTFIALAEAFQDEPKMHLTWSQTDRFDGRPLRLSIGALTLSALRCPACASHLNRSRVRWWERVYEICTTKRPYRCSRCRRRAWFDVPPQSAEDVGSKPPKGTNL